MRAARRRASAARGLALALAAFCGLCAWRDARSQLSGALRLGAPAVGIVSVRSRSQGRVVPPALYLAVYGPASRTLDLVYLPASERYARGETLADAYGDAYAHRGRIREATRAMTDAALTLLRRAPAWPDGPVFRLSVELPPDARPAFPRELKERLASWTAAPLFWLKLPGDARRAVRPEATDLSGYDAFLLSRELYRVDPERIHLSRLPEPKLLGPFLGRVFARAAGLPEPAGGTTVEVLNASSASGIAMEATKVLRWHGFDVVHFGNASSPVQDVRVLDRVGRIDQARAVLRALGCPEHDVVTDMRGSSRASVTVILGRDHARCSALQ